MKGFVHVLFGCFYVLVTFFGLGPVLLADGKWGERILTAIIVLAVYLFLIVIHMLIVRKIRR